MTLNTTTYSTLLVQYAGSKFESLDSTDIIQQRRKVLVALTVIARSQHDDTGALEMLDQLRLAVVGFKPTNCTPCHLISEEFAGEDNGFWQYQLIVQTETWQVEDRQAVKSAPKFAHLIKRSTTQPLDTRLKTKQGE
ncbi:Gp37 protein [Actinobacillus ureae]|nr:Gp37 protein [Actinobacillus ureae]SUU44926.1 Gp37 protein [Actinobacillus ureae]